MFTVQRFIKEPLISLTQNCLGVFGYKIQSLDHEIGMETCLKLLSERGFKPNVILDVGAARGDWTKLAMLYWPSSKYFLVEPLDEWSTSLKSLKEKNPNISFISAAAGSQPGELPIFVNKKNIYWSSLMAEGDWDSSRSVPVVTIDQLFQEGYFKQPQLIKLDVQGFELSVLEGAKKTMENCELMLLELQFFRFSPSMNLLHESIAWIVENGFIPYEIVDTFRRPKDKAMGQCDMLFVREDHDLISSNDW